MKFLPFGAAFVCGTVLAFLNYLFSRRMMKNKQTFFGAVAIVRQAVNIGYLVLLFFLGQKMGWDLMLLLLGGALGITVPNFILTAKLIKGEKENTKKGGDDDG